MPPSGLDRADTTPTSAAGPGHVYTRPGALVPPPRPKAGPLRVTSEEARQERVREARTLRGGESPGGNEVAQPALFNDQLVVTYKSADPFRGRGV